MSQSGESEDHSMDASQSSEVVGAEDKSKDELMQEAIEYRNALERRGVIYMSRVPPFMKPNKARSIFEEYGEVTRLFLAEEGRRFLVAFHCHYIFTHTQMHNKERNERNRAEMHLNNLKKV